MKPNFGQGLLASLIATIVGAVIYGGLFYAVLKELRFDILLPWAAIFFVVMAFIFSYTFGSPVEKKVETTKQEALDEQVGVQYNYRCGIFNIKIILPRRG